MRSSTHYYVISLSVTTNTLYEAFRDTLIDIHNQGFPVDATTPVVGAGQTKDRSEHLRDSMRVVDRHFHHYYEQDSLSVVVTGEADVQTAFHSVTAHGGAIVGKVDGDFTKTSLHDLGKIVWPVVKEALSGLQDRALQDLDIATDARRICGLEAVGSLVTETAGATLLVEEDFHVRGSIRKTDGTVTVSPSVDLRDEIDDVVDALIEKVVEMSGHVVFMPSGSLGERDRIVLLLREEAEAR
ncbi:MAG: hypothetical protein P8181_02320 [bacterium]